MEKEDSLNLQISNIAKEFLEVSKNKEVLIISHADTDGISSAAIIVHTLKKLDKRFHLKIVKELEREFIFKLPKDKTILFLDFGSRYLNHIENANLQNIFIIDHQEIIQKIPQNVKIINPQLHQKEKMTSSILSYLFAKEIDESNKEFAKLAILGMIGDNLEEEIENLDVQILTEGEIKKKEGPLIYPSTRPLNRALEYSSRPYLPGITGNVKGVLEILREAGLNDQGGYPSLLELTQEEIEKLVSAIVLKNPKTNDKKIIGNIYLLKLYNKLEDARELSAKINACAKLNDANIALQLCMELPAAKKKAESIHVQYRQSIVSALNFVSDTEKIQGKDYIIVNAKNNIKETMIGTVASIISDSKLYEEGTIIIGLAYSESGKIKISARNVGKHGRNVRDVLNNSTIQFEGEIGGHQFAAGGFINKEHENEFICELKKNLEIELVKVEH